MAKTHLYQLTICVISIVLSRAQAVTDDHGRISDKALMYKNDPNLNDEHLLQETFETVKYNPFEETDNDENYRLSHLPDNTLFKRVPTGFMGMRGKKDWEYFDLNRFDLKNRLNENNGYSYYPLNFGNKRAPNGFVGMRGKKAPSVFYGVRGKKNQYNDDELYQNDDLENLNPCSDMGNGMTNEIYGELLPLVNENDLRRSIRSNFGEFDMNSDWKRRLVDFINMGARDDYLKSNNLPKRTNNRFYATRGKKDQLSHTELLNDLLNSRAKKFWSPSFFETRGKKQPIGLRNKFVGVRGKKSSEGSLQQLETQLIDSLTGSQYNNLKPIIMDTDSNNVNMNKRVPNGFIGMRGKKEKLDNESNLSNSI